MTRLAGYQENMKSFFSVSLYEHLLPSASEHILTCSGDDSLSQFNVLAFNETFIILDLF